MKIEDITSVDEISEKMKKLFEKTKDYKDNDEQGVFGFSGCLNV